MAPLEELKRLSPQERLARLKELEESRKREIEEARNLLTDTVKEIEAEQAEKEKIPIDQLRAMDESMLLTAEEKELFRTKRFVSAGKNDLAEEVRKPTDREDRETQFESAEERRNRLEQLVRRQRAALEGGDIKQYGSPLSAVLDEMKEKYLRPKEVAERTAETLHTIAYNREMSEEEKWKTYGDAKSTMAMLEQTGAPSDEIKYVASAVQRFVDRMKMHYRT